MEGTSAQPGQDAARGLAPVVIMPPGTPSAPAAIPAPAHAPIQSSAPTAGPALAAPRAPHPALINARRVLHTARLWALAAFTLLLQAARSDGFSARARRWAAGGVFVLIVLGTALGLVALALSQERPNWWTSVNVRDPAIVEVAERFENALATIMTQARPAGIDGDGSAPWTIRVSASDVNAWLNARLPAWMESRERDGAEAGAAFKWPESVQELNVDFRDGLIHIGAKVSARGKDAASNNRAAQGNYFSAAVEPRFTPDGSLWLPARRVALGRLTVPASWMLRKPEEVARADRVPDELAKLPETREVLGAFAGRRAVMTNPTIRLGDGRRVKLLGMTAEDGRLSITCLTLVREPRRVDAGE
ncbi:MAG: hypothetical protein KF699_04775 [Phycisphaeraceae bacterium]|nr:hypothetical protein [Phycisphaeraceae bacterium]